MTIKGTGNKYLYYRPVAPQLTKRRPGEDIRLGIHCKGFKTAELVERGRLPLNLMEIKPEFFTGRDRLFYIRKGEARPHKKNFARLFAQASRQEMELQFHFPERIEGKELNPGMTGDHPLITSLLSAMAETVGEHDLLPNITCHLPLIYWKDRQNLPNTGPAIERAIKNTRNLFSKLAKKHAARGWTLQLGLENQADPTKRTHVLGYLPWHFEKVMADTPDWINFTLDVGHSLLSKNLEAERDLFPLAARLGKRVINIHFHENRGKQSDKYHGDDHALPTGAKIKGYLNYLNRSVQEQAPLILDVNTERYTNEELLVVSTGIRALMEQIEMEWEGPADIKYFVIKGAPSLFPRL